MPAFRIAPAPSLSSKIWVSFGFLMCSLLVYGASLRYAFVQLDDGLLVSQNPIVREQSLRSIGRAFTSYDPELYIPLTFLTYKVDYAISGVNPVSYRVQNVLWHTGAALLLTWMAWLIIGSPWAVLVGLLFLLHPLNTEAVVWVSARKDVLSAFWLLASVVAYLSSCRAAGDYPAQSRRLRWWSVAFFLLALLSKVVVLLLPAVLLLLDWLAGRGISRRTLMEKWPYVLLSILFGVIALFGKREMIQGLSLVPSVLVALRSTIFFLQKLFWPAGLSVLYPYDGVISLLQPVFALSLVMVLFLLSVAAMARRRWPFLSVMILWMLLFLLPTFTNFYKGGVVYLFSDRYGYLPSAGVFLLLAWCVTAVIQAAATVRLERLQTRLLIGLCAVLLVVLAQRSYAQSGVWANSETLFAHVLRLYPHSWVAQNNLANVYRRRGDLAQARSHLETALHGEPQYSTPAERQSYAVIRVNLGEIARLEGHSGEAEELYQAALREDPRNANASIGMGLLDAAAGRTPEALAHYADALLVSPGSVEALVNRGVLKLQSQDVDGAIADFRAALGAEPGQADASYNLGLALEEKGDVSGAVAAYRVAIRAQPVAIPPRINLGLALYRAGDREGSRAAFQEILVIDPKNRAARQALDQIGQ